MKGEKNMKKKRYFCDYFFGGDWDNKYFSIGIVSIFLILIVGMIFSNNIFKTKYANAFDSYSESTYMYLDEIADKVIEEGVGINLIALPDDVVKYEITYENGKTTFKYYLDNNKGKPYTISANMTIELSDDFTIISRTPNYSSEEEYVEAIKHSMFLMCIINGLAAWVVIWMSIIVICTIIALISLANKRKNTRRQ